MGIPYVTPDQLNRAAAKYDNLNDPYFEVIDCQGARFYSRDHFMELVPDIYKKCTATKKILMFKNYYIDDVFMPANVANGQPGFHSSIGDYVHFSSPYGEFFVMPYDLIFYVPLYLKLDFLPEGTAFETSVLATDTRGNDLKAYKLKIIDNKSKIPMMLDKCVVNICSESQLAQVPCTVDITYVHGGLTEFTLTFYAYQSDGSSVDIDPRDCYLAIVA